EVVNRAASKVTERVRTQQTRSRTEIFKETDFHEYNNPAKNKNVVGVYQWLNVVYQAQVFNYGTRLLFDITVPEPAAFLLDAENLPVKQAGGIPIPPRPPDLTITPGDLDPKPGGPNYYGNFAKTYAVVGIPEPPSEFITVSKAIAVAKEEDVEQAAD